MLRGYFRIISRMMIFMAIAAFLAVPAMGNDMGIGIPLGGADDNTRDICPIGVKVVETFLSAWSRSDYRTMYELIDDAGKDGYPFEEAKFDFQFMEFKPYRISSVSKSGDNYDFILSFGDWKDGDKDIKKMEINGRTFKVIMPRRGEIFKRSSESYF
ncbi:MAG: hypothetical protein ABIA77_02535 [Candidatus Omnitrophota bacterium]